MPKLSFFALALATLASAPSFAMSTDARAHLLGGFLPSAADLQDPDVKAVVASPYWTSAAANGSLASVLRSGKTLFAPGSRAQMNQFFSANLGPAREATRGLLYFFSGPDVLYPNLLFPNLEHTVQVGLEAPGVLPDPSALLASGGLALRMGQIAAAYRDIMRTSYFITSNMAKDLASFGTSTMISVGLVANGFTVEAAEPVELDANGNVIEGKATNGVRIRYRKPSGAEGEVVYFRLNLSNESLKNNPAFERYLAANQFESAYYKAASFVSSNRDFSSLNELVLSKVEHVIQNDDGIPFHVIRENASHWDLRLFGLYTKPAPMFMTTVQADLRAAYDHGICLAGSAEDRALWAKLWPATCTGAGSDFGFASLRWEGYVPFRYGYAGISGPRIAPDRNRVVTLMVLDRAP